MQMKNILTVAALVLLISAPPVVAVEPLSAATLKYYCKGFAEAPKSTLSQKCVAYIGGFLDGAIATDERVAENVVGELEDGESFTERAFRTRIYGKLRDSGPSVYAEFCVGDPVPLKEVVLKVATELNERMSVKGFAARTIVYAVMREHYPCSE